MLNTPCHWVMNFDGAGHTASKDAKAQLPKVAWKSELWGARQSGEVRKYLEDWKPLDKKVMAKCGRPLSELDDHPKAHSAEEFKKEQMASWLRMEARLEKPDQMLQSARKMKAGCRLWEKPISDILACDPQMTSQKGHIRVATAVNVGPSRQTAKSPLASKLFAGLLFFQAHDRFFAFGRRGGGTGDIVAYYRVPGSKSTVVEVVPDSAFSPAGTALVQDTTGLLKPSREWASDYWIRLEWDVAVSAGGVEIQCIYAYDASVWRMDDQCQGDEHWRDGAVLNFGTAIAPNKAYLSLVAFCEASLVSPPITGAMNSEKAPGVLALGSVAGSGRFLSLIVNSKPS